MSSATLNVVQNANGTVTISGNIGSTQLSKPYVLEIFFTTTKTGAVPLGTTTLTPNGLGQINGFSFTTSTERQEFSNAVNPRDQSITFVVSGLS